jgi:predicted dehydrogenase
MRRYVEWDSPWMAEKSQAGGGALLNLGGHGFDIARFVTGEEPISANLR